ncbi:ORF6N domain-containing protein [Proteus mirabilis]|nr:ORF6N domain-containing protein [Proteus mirabilis]
MANIAKTENISNSVKSLHSITHHGTPVITTGIMSKLYETDDANIKMNFSRNISRFTEGKHFFKLEGIELKQFKDKVTKSYPVKIQNYIVGKRAKSLILWTERGAARHAKMLDTDKAWDVFEALEDFYFTKKEDAKQKTNFRQSTAKELIPLRQTAERLIAHGVGNIYPDIWKHIHKEFGVEHINELLPEQIPLAISYLDALEGEYIPKETPREVTQERTNRDMDAHHVNVLAKHYEAIYTAWKVELYPALCSVDSPIAYRLRDRLQDGYSILIRLQESLNGKHPVLIK